MALREAPLREEFGGKADEVKPAAWKPRMVLKKMQPASHCFSTTPVQKGKVQPSPDCVSLVLGKVSF